MPERDRQTSIHETEVTWMDRTELRKLQAEAARVMEDIRKEYINRPTPKVLYIPTDNPQKAWDVLMGHKGSGPAYFYEKWFRQVQEQCKVKDMEKPVLSKDNSREEAFVTYKKVGNEIVVTKNPQGDFQVNINRHSGDLESRDSIVVPREFGRLLGEALLKDTETRTGCGVGEMFFDSPEFHLAWEKWVKRH